MLEFGWYELSLIAALFLGLAMVVMRGRPYVTIGLPGLLLLGTGLMIALTSGEPPALPASAFISTAPDRAYHDTCHIVRDAHPLLSYGICLLLIALVLPVQRWLRADFYPRATNWLFVAIMLPPIATGLFARVMMLRRNPAEILASSDLLVRFSLLSSWAVVFSGVAILTLIGLTLWTFARRARTGPAG